MLAVIGEELRSPKGPSAAVFVWGGALLIHVVMSGAWVFDVRLHRAWPILGVLFGVGSLAVLPLHAAGAGAPLEVAISSSLQLLTFQLALVAPCVLLALWLVRFHLKAEVAEVTSSQSAGA